MKTGMYAKAKKRVKAFSLIEVMAVSAIVTSIPTGAYVRAKQKAYETECRHNLQQIGKMIVMYQMGEGEYPDAVFYPEEPFKDEKSIIRVMEDGGMSVPREMWICSAAPDALKKKGLTFVYNDNYGGRSSLSHPERGWLMIEVNCASKKVPPPHPGGYNILFADGHVVTTKSLPRSITSKQKASLERLREDVEGGGRLAALFEDITRML